MKQLDYKPKCFRLHFDVDTCDIGVLVDILGNFGDIFYNDSALYIFSANPDVKDTIKSVFQQQKIEEVYCEPIKICDQFDQNTPLAVWYKEVYEAHFLEAINNQYADDIKAADDNIRKYINEH